MDNLCKWEKGKKRFIFHVNADQKMMSAEEFSTQVDRMTLPCTVSLFPSYSCQCPMGP